MNVRLLQVLFLCLLLALCGCGKGKNTDKTDQPADLNTTPATADSNAAGEPQNGNTLMNEGPYHAVDFEAFENCVDMLKSRKAVSELFKNYGKWAPAGTADGGVFFTDMESELTYGFDSSYFEDFAQPALKGNEVFNTISGAFSVFYPGVYLPDKETTHLYLNILFSAEFTQDYDEYSEYYGSFSAFLENYGVFIIVATDEGQIKPDSVISITYQPE